MIKTKNSFYSRYGKRWVDLLLTIPGFVVISPALVIIALLVRLQLGSPVLFKQVRPGLDGKPFTIYKFRTMTDAMDNDGKLLPNAQRLTKLLRPGLTGWVQLNGRNAISGV
jgi:lipopolysaccharide/colanic/teichoic acid biosynthesis glycosyltransferase